MAPSSLRTAAAVLAATLAAPAAAAAGTNANGQIVFSSFRDGRAGDLWSVSPDGRDLRKLTGDPEPAVTVNDAQADWSPDGRAIAFRRGPGATVDLGVWRMAWDGSGQSLLSAGAGPLNSTQPSWAPDGGSLLFRANRPPFADTDIWAMGTDGSDQRRLFHLEGQQFYPSWSPDMTRIAFTTPFTTAQRRGVFTVAPDGSDLRTVIDLPGSDESAPNWSPDGSRLAFESDVDGDGEIFVVGADGTGLVKLTDNAIHDEGPSWSPDGRRLVYTSGPVNLEGDIWVMEADGSGRTRLTDSPGRDESPDWQPVPLGDEMTACGDADATGPGASSVHAVRLDCRRALDAAARWARAATAGDPPAQVRGLFCDAAPTAGAGRLVTCTRRGATGTTVRFLLRD